MDADAARNRSANRNDEEQNPRQSESDRQRSTPFNQETLLADGGQGGGQNGGEFILPQFVNYSNNETQRNKVTDAMPMMYGQGHGQGGEDDGLMQRSNTQFNMRSQYYEPLPFDEQIPMQQREPENSQFDKMQNNKERVVQGQTVNEWDETAQVNDKVQFSDQQNIKCSIEIKNGIPQRSLNNFHKNQNALVLNNYTVSTRHQIAV